MDKTELKNKFRGYVVGLAVCLLATGCGRQPGSTTNVRDYARVRSRQHGAWVKHMPRAIQSHATKVDFYYQPEWETVWYVEYDLPHAEVEAILKADRPLADQEWNSSNCDSPSSSDPGLRQDIVEKCLIPKHYTVLLFPAWDSKSKARRFCNNSGVAVSTKKNHVIYFAQTEESSGKGGP
jgi:hypothetical protein